MAPKQEEVVVVDRVTAYHCNTLEYDESGALGMIPVPEAILKKLGWKKEQELELMVIDGGQVLIRSRGFGIDAEDTATEGPA